MLDPGGVESVTALICQAAGEAQPWAETVQHFGEGSPKVEAYVARRLPFSSEVVHNHATLQDLNSYAELVTQGDGSAWMDNTTLLTADVLLSDAGPEFMTPLTVWDLVTFCRAVVCYERVYHHEHPDIDDARMNRMLGDDILCPVPLPNPAPQPTRRSVWPALRSRLSSTTLDREPADPCAGAYDFMCELWSCARHRLDALRARVGTRSLDGEELAALRNAWSRALQRDDLDEVDLVNASDASIRWTSPSVRLLYEIADATGVRDTRQYLDPQAGRWELFEAAGATMHAAHAKTRLGMLLTDLNIRAYVNQRLADFFELPYAPAAARVPFRRHLYDRAVSVQQTLYSMDVLENRYAELGGGVTLRLPIFLAIALLGTRAPNDLWHNIGEQRYKATPFRARRIDLDAALGRQDRKEVVRISKALHTDADSVLAVLGGAAVAGGLAVVEEVAKGDPGSVALGVAAVGAASQRLVSSSLIMRLMWRLRRPHLLYLSNLVDEAHNLTEALPDFARVWRIPEREQARFASRFLSMAKLQRAAGGHTTGGGEPS